MINFDEILKSLTLILTNAVATLPQKEKDLAMDYLKGLEERFLFYLNQLEAGTLSLNDVIALLENEPQIIISQVESLGIVAGADIEGAINDAIDLLITSIPTVTVEGETKADFTQSTYSKEVGVLPTGTISKGSQTQFGLFTSGELLIPDVITLAKKLGVTTVRFGLNMDEYKGKSIGLEQLLAAGLQVLVNLNFKTIRDDYGLRVPQPWVQQYELEDYESQARAILTKYPNIYAVVVDNEETVNLFHSGEASEYVTQLSVMSKVCRSLGIKVTNGGLTNPGLQILVYRNLQNNSQTVAANNFYNNCMDTRTRKAAKYPGSNAALEAKAAETDYLLSNYGKLVDFVNIHWYEPLIKTGGIFNTINRTKTSSPDALKNVVDYVVEKTGKPVISNETGTLNSQSELVTAIMKDMQSVGIKVCVWFSATSDSGQTDPLNIGTDLTEEGEAFQKFLN